MKKIVFCLFLVLFTFGCCTLTNNEDKNAISGEIQREIPAQLSVNPLKVLSPDKNVLFSREEYASFLSLNYLLEKNSWGNYTYKWEEPNCQSLREFISGNRLIINQPNQSLEGTDMWGPSFEGYFSCYQEYPRDSFSSTLLEYRKMYKETIMLTFYNYQSHPELISSEFEGKINDLKTNDYVILELSEKIGEEQFAVQEIKSHSPYPNYENIEDRSYILLFRRNNVIGEVRVTDFVEQKNSAVGELIYLGRILDNAFISSLSAWKRLENIWNSS